MVNTYTVLKTLHVLGATSWVGGAFLIQMMYLVVDRLNDTRRMADFLGLIGKIGERVFIPSSLLILISGLWLTIKYDYIDFGAFWISWGLTVWLLSFIVGAAYLGPSAKKGEKLLEAEDFDGYAALLRPVMVISRIELVLLILTIVFMVIKP